MTLTSLSYAVTGSDFEILVVIFGPHAVSRKTKKRKKLSAKIRLFIVLAKKLNHAESSKLEFQSKVIA